MNQSLAEGAIVLAPRGRDAPIAVAMLAEAGLTAAVATDLPDLVRQLQAGAGFAIVTEEALLGADLRAVNRFLAAQEEWSDFPFILLTQRGGGLERNPGAVRFLETLGNVTFLERPFHPTTMISLAKAALRARHRQYEARERLVTINASAAQFRAFAEAVPNHVWTSSPDGMLDWFNERVFEYSGLPLARLVGTGWTSLVHPDDVAAASALWRASLDGGHLYETEFRIRRTDGSYRWHLVRALPIRAEDGTILRWIGTNTDIHVQKLTEAESVRDRNRLWMLSQDMMMVTDFSGIITAVNPSATRLLNWTEDEMVGAPLSRFVHPDDIPATIREVEKLSAGIPTLAFENRFRARSGDYRLIDWNAVPDQGRIHAVGRDITAERNLARDRERIWKLSPVLKIVAELDGKVIAVNPSWTRVLGWAEAETVGRNITEFSAPENAQASRDAVAALVPGVMFEAEREYMTRDGERRRIAWITVPENGTLYAFGRDITAERESAEALAATEDALRQSQKMEAVGQLTGGIAHDFNNLLQGITGNLELLGRRIEQGRTGDLSRFVDGAATAAQRAAALTHRLLAFSRRQPLDPKPVLANPLLRSMEDLLHRTLGERIELTLDLADELGWTMCDGNQLENAILNLVINARDAMPEGGRLVVRTSNETVTAHSPMQRRERRPGDYVCIAVSDTGTGMDEATIAKAFEPFFTTKPLGQGTGLGLSMIYGFARQSDGFAAITSTCGEGTTISLYLPRTQNIQQAAERRAETVDATPLATGRTVLVVEDEPIVRGLILEVLDGLGYRTLEAADGAAGLAHLQSDSTIDLLLTDVGLPGLNGRQVADAGRTLRPDLKILFMTGYAENASLAPGSLVAGMGLITKPFQMEDLARQVKTMVESG